MASENETVYRKYKVLDAKTGKEKRGRYFVLKTDAKNLVERCAVLNAIAMYAAFHKTHGNARYAEEVMRYVKGM